MKMDLFGIEGKTWQENTNLVNLKNNISINQISSHVIKMASKKVRLSETERFIEPWHEEENLWNILSENYKTRQEKEKSFGKISEKLEMISNQ